MSSTASLSSLLKQTHITSHSDILAAANTTLKSTQHDTAAQFARLVALLNLNRFADAVKAYESGNGELKSRATKEYAYALYKAGQWDQASKIATSTDPDAQKDRGLLHIAAQTAYRLEDFETAAKIYDQLADDQEGAGEANDIRINRGAVDAQLEWKGLGDMVSKKKPQREDLEAFESAYNVACASIGRGELGQAEILLRRAKDLLSASADFSDEERASELLPLTVQQIYVLLRQGRNDEATKLIDELHIHNIADRDTRRIAAVNALVSSPSVDNPFVLHRQFNDTPALANNDTPFQYQASILQQDKYVVDLLAMKHSGVITSVNSVLTKQKDTSAESKTRSLSVLKAAAHACNQTGKPALTAILPYLEQRPNDVGLLMTVVQLYIMTNNHGSAAALLETFLNRLQKAGTPNDLNVRFSPGLVGTLVALYKQQGRQGQMKSELARAAKYWRSKSEGTEDTTKHATLLKAAGTALLHDTDEGGITTASVIFKDLRQKDGSDKAAAAGLVASLALSDPSTIQNSDLDALPAVQRMIAGIDVAALEDAGVAKSAQLLISSASKKRPADDSSKPSKPKKIRKSKMPKDFDPNKKVDPERWLPMRDRSYYKPKGKKGKARAAGLTQGGPVDEKPAPQQEQAKTSTVQSSAAKKKKKGKGGR